METIINEQAIPSTIARLTDIPDIPDIPDTYYITDFTVEDLRNMIASGSHMQADTQGIGTALTSNKIVLVPYASGTGYELLTGYDEDFLYAYVSSLYYEETYFIEADVNSATFDSTNCGIATMIFKETADRTFVTHEPVGDLEIVANVHALSDDLTYALPTSATGDEDDIIATKNTLKTINGESIVGSGDITISGGSSSGGSSAYSEVNHGTADTTFTLTPNTFHVWDEVASLTLDFGSETSGVANEFLFQFTSGATATSLTLPNDIKWANDSAPTITENMTYQVSILKGLASVLEFSNAVEKVNNTITGTVGGNTITSQYPVASDITIEYWDYPSADDIHTVVMPAGTSEVTTTEKFNYIENVSPVEDDNFYYIY